MLIGSWSKRDGVAGFTVLLHPCSILKYLVTRRRICWDRREQVPVVVLQAECFVTLPLILAHGIVLGCVCVGCDATMATMRVEFSRCQRGNLPVAVPVPHCLCLNEVLSIFNLGEGWKSGWLKMLCLLSDFSFLLINNSLQCCGDMYSLWKINSYRLLVTKADFWCPDKGKTYQLAGSGAPSGDQGIPLDIEDDGWPSCSLFTLISASVPHMFLKLEYNFISNSSVKDPLMSWFVHQILFLIL